MTDVAAPVEAAPEPAPAPAPAPAPVHCDNDGNVAVLTTDGNGAHNEQHFCQACVDRLASFR